MSWLERRIVVVSNRLPVTIEESNAGFRLEASSGGLVTALRPLLNDCAGVWVGWTGTDASPAIEALLENYSRTSNFVLKPVFMGLDERSRFYVGFSNEILWPLLHDLQSRCNFDPTYWDTYLNLNRRFAETAAVETHSGNVVWVHDYHLMSVGTSLRQLGINERLTYFHHIPFPSPDIFEKLPWRKEILTALLDYDVLGFQTLRDRRNFVACLRKFVKHAQPREYGEQIIVDSPRRTTFVGAFPIGIDYEEFAHGASDHEVATRAKKIVERLNGCRVILGVDRLDYTKGIPERLAAYRHLLELHPERRQRVALVEVVVPSREDIPKYLELKTQIEQQVSEINGEYGEPGWVPIHYIHRSLDRPELLAYYRAAHIALITPLKDGMNLVAKEYCAARVHDDGVLILSEFAGSAFQLNRGALLVNPYDTRAVAEAIEIACDMPPVEQKKRIQKLKACIRQEDIFHWRDSFWGCGELGTRTPRLATARAVAQKSADV
jgi:trehalose 6-phosphate synthase/phosphatase